MAKKKYKKKFKSKAALKAFRIKLLKKARAARKKKKK